MVKVIHEVPYPHDCSAELRQVSGMELWIGSVVECSCGDRHIRAEDQREGFYWRKLPKPVDGWSEP